MRTRDRRSALDDPALVRAEYASEERLAARSAVYKDLREGPDARDVAFEAIRESDPARILEVGCGDGQFAARMQRELEAVVVALDVSPRMVELARSRGVGARLGDVQDLPFADGEFDCVVASWVLYHVPDLDRALAETARVLRPAGRLVAVTFGERNLSELWELLGDDAPRRLPFSSENGAPALARHFDHLSRRDVEADIVFPDRAAVRNYVAATITRAHLVDRIPEIDGPFRARSLHSVFVAGR